MSGITLTSVHCQIWHAWLDTRIVVNDWKGVVKWMAWITGILHHLCSFIARSSLTVHTIPPFWSSPNDNHWRGMWLHGQECLFNLCSSHSQSCSSLLSIYSIGLNNLITPVISINSAKIRGCKDRWMVPSGCLKSVGVVDEYAATMLIDHPKCCCYTKTQSSLMEDEVDEESWCHWCITSLAHFNYQAWLHSQGLHFWSSDRIDEHLEAKIRTCSIIDIATTGVCEINWMLMNINKWSFMWMWMEGWLWLIQDCEWHCWGMERSFRCASLVSFHFVKFW